MKDTIITAVQKKRELKILGLSFVAAFLFNIFAIVRYNQPFKEVFTQLHIVLMLTFVFYFIFAALRIIAWFIKLIYVKVIRKS